MSGQRERGPLAELLNARIDPAGPSTGLRLVVDTQAWMGNMFGTMHGGVIATIVGVACSFAGQRQTHAGQDYRVGDLSVAFFRSPPVDGSRVSVDVEAVKVGRRIASFSARMTGPDGTLLAEGAADIHFG
ncbi:PaaI family thioesterase [Gordonia otitidis]|uniref:PaaI family thioesterase n=1 Tax=Gordonia otitidis TaxID=249058 RepID=UPI001F40A954|nr:PaaI family thioesterase [Gordonia otitidis]